jgi:SAM-dependent methyltransferase
MGELYNLLRASTKYYDGPPRPMDATFGLGYWDGSRDTGYGGYHYDGRWKPIAEDAVRRYGLKPGARVLDVGCGKGFFLADLLQVLPDAQVAGLDVSEYALAHAPAAVKPLLHVGSADDLSAYPDHSFDFVCAMNSLHFLPPAGTERGLREIMRVGKPGKYFIHVDAFNNATERERLLAWAPIIKTIYSVQDWHDLFARLGYDGDYYWTIVQPTAQKK